MYVVCLDDVEGNEVDTGSGDKERMEARFGKWRVPLREASEDGIVHPRIEAQAAGSMLIRTRVRGSSRR